MKKETVISVIHLLINFAILVVLVHWFYLS